MKRIIDIIRMTIISPELVCILLIYMLSTFFHKFFVGIGIQFKSRSELWIFLLPIITSLAGVSSWTTWKLRAPMENNSNKALFKWPEYHRITDRIHVAMTLCFLSCAGAIFLWIFNSSIEESLLGCLLLICFGISLITTYTMINASQRLREIIETFIDD